MRIPFVKMSGAGNDAILVDHRSRFLAGREAEFARAACERRFGIGADALILLEDDASADFRVRFFNPDGGEYALCGNGARCVPLYAAEIGLSGTRCEFVSASGRHRGEMLPGGWGRVEIAPVREIRLDLPADVDGRPVRLDWADIGVPHAVLWVEDAASVPIDRWGPHLRRHPVFGPEGSNVSFVERGSDRLRIRTFERGVEGETWACGSGSSVVATIACRRGWTRSPVDLAVRSGGHLRIHVPAPGSPDPIVLEGPVTRCFDGRFEFDPVSPAR